MEGRRRDPRSFHEGLEGDATAGVCDAYAGWLDRRGESEAAARARLAQQLTPS